MGKQLRRFIRHPSGIPIEVRALSEPATGAAGGSGERIRDIGFGGLAFAGPARFQERATVEVRIPMVDPAFQTRGEVVWCRPRGDGYETGLRFDRESDLYTLRMVEQVCHIEHYRREVARREARALTSDQAAAEWISLYANAFPDFRPTAED